MAGIAEAEDEFEQLLRIKMGDANEEQIAGLLALRATLPDRGARAMALAEERLTAEALNARNQQILERARTVLGDDQYRLVFGVEPGDAVNLIDPNVFRRMQNAEG
ncbi:MULTISPECIES: hypothetical protein [Methylomonas]|uniref:Uncharacterized protein n=1 Tax=Methylomonas koyamae TaxID=702114 RepID=A0A177PBC7_9GAMM|nr:hypothetical protein [Methylomonas koyamae]OAI27576.1 hypothetical protein A1355_18165 [Methylomonas koyamae]